ncbi:PREDICTED: LOW QUALITY PROTEIN: zinc finger and SCAN domain-containing protein 18 [Propithecus coquereli]|uniref:LOW QUALITY PROTEIN: zinc finger and SCAN domain-containing protein 18 n=1 Tax=Propithecus coquereli TaxID=379532 RepID=UPI00063F3AF6|nr:PREDICTED: LOW QUALITY PROTEIN: zinc finger and SCAN domain-containing protein 18 [Propithecus coquereli]
MRRVRSCADVDAVAARDRVRSLRLRGCGILGVVVRGGAQRARAVWLAAITPPGLGAAGTRLGTAQQVLGLGLGTPEPPAHPVILGVSPLELPCPRLDTLAFRCRFGKMLPLEKAFSSPRSSPTPPELPTAESAAEVQQEEPKSEIVTDRTPADLEFSRLRFREFVYQEAAGPHQTLARLHELCRQWLMPEARSKEQMLELLVLEQFLGILPDRVRPWVVAQYPESCKKAASLVEGLADVLDEPGMLLGSPAGSSSVLSEGVYERFPEPLLFPVGPLSPSQDLGRGYPPTPWPSMEPLLPELGSMGEAKTEEADPATAEPKKPESFWEEPLHQEEWGHLDPAEENMKSYRKLLLWGYQFSQPDAASSLETEEDLRLVEKESAEGDLPDSGKQQEGTENKVEDVSTCETPKERLEGDCPADPSGTTEEEEEQPQKTPDPQDGDSNPASENQMQLVTQEPEEDKDEATPAAPQQGLGTKRPHPEDVEEQGPEPGEASGEPDAAGQDPGPSAAGCPETEEPDASRGKPFACSECGEAFAWISHLMEHHGSHGGRKRFACQGCWKTFHFSLALAEHQKTHEKEKGYVLGAVLGSHPATREAHASGSAGRAPESAEGEVCPGPPEEAEAQR